MPDLLDEIDGIARASRVPRSRVLALNLLDEEWWFRRAHRRGLKLEHCSSFGIAPGDDRSTLLGQNMDLPSWLDGLQVLFAIRAGGFPQVLVPSYAGMLGTNAFNDRGVGVCVNSLLSLPHSQHGLPVSFVIRAVGQAPDYRTAVSILKRVPHASGQCYLVGAPDRLGCFECSSKAVAEYSASRVLVHTNHPLVQSSIEDSGQAGDEPSESNSSVRFDYLISRMGDGSQINPHAARKVLATAPLCRGGGADSGFTFYSVIMEPAKRRLLLTAGPPSRHSFVAFEFASPTDQS
jgi:isopenicillin-N N-acyltransferase like protein